jgi:putative ABC transport system ATP-binding protein
VDLPEESRRVIFRVDEIDYNDPQMSVRVNTNPAQDRRKKMGGSQTDRLSLVELRDVVKVYESVAGKFLALKGINLKINRGEFVSVVGKSGSGKSTLMNMITGIDRPTEGEVIIGNTPIYKLSENKVAIWRGNTVGIVFQFFQLLPTLTVIENIMLPMDFCHKYSLRQRRERSMYLLEQVELTDQAYKLPLALSGGQQQRVAIARALANDPPMVVADEPTGNLDTGTSAAVFELFERLVHQGKTIVMVTHDQDLVKQVPRIIFLKDGRVIEDRIQRAELPKETPDDLVEPSHDDRKGSAILIQSARERVAVILNNRDNEVELLRKVLLEAPKDREGKQEVYRAILDEITQRAELAEQGDQVEEARRLWKILMEASDF